MTQVAVNGQIYSYSEIGNGNSTPLLVLHGWGRNGNEWMRMAQELSVSSRRKVYVVDLPGFGGSSLPTVKNIFEYSQLVVDFCKYLEIPKVVVIGHSLGGRVGIVLGARYPELIKKLILIDPAGVKHKSIKRGIIQVIARMFAWFPVLWRRKIMQGMMDEDYRNSPNLRVLYRAIVKDDLTKLLPQIECETLVIWGEKDPILTLSLTKVYREKLVNCRVRVIWGAGHNPHLSHYRQLLRILEEVWI